MGLSRLKVVRLIMIMTRKIIASTRYIIFSYQRPFLSQRL